MCIRDSYVEANLKDKKLDFTVDTTYQRRLSPSQFYEKNDKPILVVNTTFFSFTTNQNLNVVIKDNKLLGYNIHTINGRGKDTCLLYTSDAADERSSVDLGGRRIIKKTKYDN